MNCPRCHSSKCNLGSHSFSSGRIHDAEWHCESCGWNWMENETFQVSDSHPPLCTAKEWHTAIHAAAFLKAYPYINA